jgi:aspartyl/asparaginyl beta-hydroxylase (cupin superfamily)
MRQQRAGLKKVFDYHIVKDAVNNYLYRHAGGDRRPVHFDDIAAVNPGLDRLTRHFATIKQEFDAVFDQGLDLPAYHDVDPGEAQISANTDGSQKKWGVFLLYLLGHKPAINRSRCPETARLLDGVPGLVQAFFSVLDPHKSVPEHEGPYVGYLRYHLALKVPTDHPPTLRVKDWVHRWKEGEAILFDDSYPHEVVNHSDQHRAVLIVDVRRPMRGSAEQLNRFMVNVVARHTYGRSVAKRANNFVGDPKK